MHPTQTMLQTFEPDFVHLPVPSSTSRLRQPPVPPALPPPVPLPSVVYDMIYDDPPHVPPRSPRIRRCWLQKKRNVFKVVMARWISCYTCCVSETSCRRCYAELVVVDRIMTQCTKCKTHFVLRNGVWVYLGMPTRANVEKEDCAICLQELAHDTVVLTCGHTYHTECMHKWFRHCAKFTCPMRCELNHDMHVTARRPN